MKLRPQCIPCILDVRLRELRAAIRDPEEAYRLSVDYLVYASKVFREEREATRAASILFNKVVEIAPGVVEYYRRIKRTAIDTVKKNIGMYKELLEELKGYEKFRIAVKMAISGNALDTGVSGYKPPELISIETIISTPITIDETTTLYQKVSSGGLRILYLLDNAGEMIYDTLLMELLRDYGNKVIAVVKKDPGFQNDATISDAEYAKLNEYVDEVVSTGTNASSIHLDKISVEFKKYLESADLVIAKGMAHYEYISSISLGKPVFFLLIPKCDVIAEALKTRKHTYVVYSVKP